MNTILLPTDFSDASLNAGKYALGFAKQVGAKKIIFYHTYAVPVNFNVVPTEPVMLNDDLVDFDIMKDSALNGLKHFQQQLKNYSFPGLEMELIVNYGFFTEDIRTTQKNAGADIIIMGITGGGAFTENIIGSDTVVVARQSSVPVIIVPAKNEFKGIDKIMLISDFSEIEKSVPANQLKAVLDSTKATLLILHVAKMNEERYDEDSSERLAFENLFNGYNPEFYFTECVFFSDGVNHFAENNDVDLVVVIPKKHNLIESLFIKSHTKELAFHSHIPLMVVHS